MCTKKAIKEYKMNTNDAGMNETQYVWKEISGVYTSIHLLEVNNSYTFIDFFDDLILFNFQWVVGMGFARFGSLFNDIYN